MKPPMPPRIFPLLVATALLLFGSGLVVTILPLRWIREGVSAETIAFIGSANYFGMLLGAACGPALVRRLGGHGAGMTFATVIATSTLLVLAVRSPTAYSLARLAGGFGLTGLYLVIETGLNTLARPECRSRVLAIYMIVFYLAQAGGAAISGAAAEPPLLIGASVLILLSGLPPSGGRAIPPAETSIGTTAHLWCLAPHGYLAAFTAGIVFGCFYALGPLYAQAGAPASGAAGRFMAVAMLGGVAAMRPIATCADHQPGYVTAPI